MNRFDWDGLILGDEVFVHHPMGSVDAARQGAVTAVTDRGRRENAVAIRLLDGEHEVVHPSRLSSHRTSVDRSGDCWRCHELDVPTPAGATA